MNYGLIGWLFLILVFASGILLVTAPRHRSAFRSKIRIIIGAVFVFSIFSLPILSHLKDVETWNDVQFDGVVLSIKITKNHALKEYRITDESGSPKVILDKLWKLDKFKVGDRVTKRMGEGKVTTGGEANYISPPQSSTNNAGGEGDGDK